MDPVSPSSVVAEARETKPRMVRGVDQVNSQAEASGNENNVTNNQAEASENKNGTGMTTRSRGVLRSQSFNESDSSVAEAREKLNSVGKMIKLSIPDNYNESFARNEHLLKLRNAAASAISKVVTENKARNSLLTSTLRDNNNSLQSELSDAFINVNNRIEERISALPIVAMLSTDSSGTMRITPFNGSSESCGQFSMWLRRLEDILRARAATQTDEQKANFLICHLEGVAREKVEELTDAQKKNYDEVVNHLRVYCEGPQQKHLARQHLSSCKQHAGESAVNFASRVLNLVRAVTAGQDTVAQKERALEEFVARLRPEIRYHVKLDGPTSLEKAINRAETVEQLLSEALSDRLINPVNAIEVPLVNAGTASATNSTYVANGKGNKQQSWSNKKNQQNNEGQFRPDIECYNCGGQGHMSRQCSSPKRPQAQKYSNSNQSSEGARQPNVCNLQVQEDHVRKLWEAQSQIEALSIQAEHSRRELFEAKNSLSETSTRLKQTSEALDFSQQRCDALVTRNGELSDGVFERSQSVETRVFARHGNSVPDSAAGDLHECKYSDGDCSLHDGATIIWTPTEDVFCRNHGNPIMMPH